MKGTEPYFTVPETCASRSVLTRQSLSQEQHVQTIEQTTGEFQYS